MGSFTEVRLKRTPVNVRTTDTFLCTESTNFHFSTTLIKQTLVIFTLSMNGYLTSENLTKTRNDLEKFLSNESRVIVTLLPLVPRQAKVKTTRYTIQLVICAPFSRRFSK